MVRYSGTVACKMPYSTAAVSPAAKRKKSASLASMVKAITMAPSTKNGERITSRIIIATESCAWLMSLVMRVMSEGVPSLSSSAWEKRLICRKKALRSSVPNPWEQRAAQYWQISAHMSPNAPKKNSNTPIFST